ncbi:class 1 isoprenoid biosynthesis enzyme [Amycolatopsis orientalis]|uniref:class 1 isoprenoid biosynthesis enzyme n=1 Tax=Amycolatopsis orientalis TaxID=31958 RepID=UPI000569CCA3|nr:class 1 isoprenoid biosynthesis enzyme [Amycolatopsis orientalis]
MGGVLRDALGVMRCVPMAAGLPGVVRYVVRDAREIMGAFDEVVAPLVDQSVGTTPALSRDAHDAFLATTIKVGLAMRGYAEMAGVPFDPALAALGSSFTRVYDDLVDNFDRPDLDDRLAELFRGEAFEPMSGVESLLLALYHAMETRMDRPAEDTIFTVMRDLHDYERQSRRQRDPRLPLAEVERITRGKGGLGVTALFALLRPGMTADELDLLVELGDVLQLLDDYHDVAVDHRDGVVTVATLGEPGLAVLAEKIRRLRSRFARHYGEGRDRRLAAMLFVMLVGAFAAGRRRLDRPVRSTRSRRPFVLLFSRTGTITPDGAGFDD